MSIEHLVINVKVFDEWFEKERDDVASTSSNSRSEISSERDVIRSLCGSRGQLLSGSSWSYEIREVGQKFEGGVQESQCVVQVCY